MVFLLFWLVGLVAAVLWCRPDASLQEQIRFGIFVALPVSLFLIVLGWFALHFVASLRSST
jgi:hypothetical protein